VVVCWWRNSHEKRLDMNEVLSLAKTMEVGFLDTVDLNLE
jgi:hypothetical protein